MGHLAPPLPTASWELRSGVRWLVLSRPGIDSCTHLCGGLSRGSGVLLLSQACPGVPKLAQPDGHPPSSLRDLPPSFFCWGWNLATCVPGRAQSCSGNTQKLERPVGVRV